MKHYVRRQLSKTKIGRFVNSFFYKPKTRIGECKPSQCSTLDGVVGAACCKLGYRCPALTDNHSCGIYSIRFKNCRVFPANEDDLKLVKNCGYKFE